MNSRFDSTDFVILSKDMTAAACCSGLGQWTDNTYTYIHREREIYLFMCACWKLQRVKETALSSLGLDFHTTPIESSVGGEKETRRKKKTRTRGD